MRDRRPGRMRAGSRTSGLRQGVADRRQRRCHCGRLCCEFAAAGAKRLGRQPASKRLQALGCDHADLLVAASSSTPGLPSKPSNSAAIDTEGAAASARHTRCQAYFHCALGGRSGGALWLRTRELLVQGLVTLLVQADAALATCGEQPGARRCPAPSRPPSYGVPSAQQWRRGAA